MIPFKTSNVRRFFVQQERPGLDDVTGVLQGRAHKEIDPSTDVEESAGWCGFWDDRPADPVQLDAGLVGFGLRIDTLKVPASLLATKTRDACEALAAELEVEQLDKFQRDEVKVTQLRELRRRIPAKTTHVQVVWIDDEGRDTIYLLTGSDQVATQFHELFEQTFDIALIPDTAYARLRGGELATTLDAMRIPAFIRVGSSVMQALPATDADFIERVCYWQRLGLAFLHHLAFLTTERPQALNDRKIEFLAGDKVDLARGDEAVKFRKGDPLQSLPFGELVTSGSLLEALELRLVDEESGDEFKFTVTGQDLKLSGITLPKILADEPEERVVEACLLFDKLFGILDTALERFAEQSEIRGVEAFDHIDRWIHGIANAEE